MAAIKNKQASVITSTAKELKMALGSRYSTGLDSTIYVAASALVNYRKLVAQRACLDEYYYELGTKTGTKLVAHPIFALTSDAMNDCIKALKALGLTLSKTEAKPDIDPIDLLSE